LKLTTDRHEASRGLFATAELLVLTSSSNKAEKFLRKRCLKTSLRDFLFFPRTATRTLQIATTVNIKHYPYYCTQSNINILNLVNSTPHLYRTKVSSWQWLSIAINIGSYEHGYIKISVIAKRPFSLCWLKQHHLYI